MKITFIGGGNMAKALIGGLRRQGYSAPGIQVVEPLAENREKLSEEFSVRCVEKLDAAVHGGHLDRRSEPAKTV